MLIPRQVLFGNPTKVNPLIAPDGRHIAYIAPDDNNVLQVWLRSLGREDDTTLTQDKRRGIQMHAWTSNPDVLVFLQDADGDENWHLYAVNIKTNTVTDLTPYQGVQARFVAKSHRVPDELLVGLNLADGRKHDVHRVNLRTGDVLPDTVNPGNIVGWCSDEDLRVRAALAMDPTGAQQLLVRKDTEAAWSTAFTFSAEEQGWPVSFSVDGSSLYFLTNQGAPALRLLSVDLASGVETVISEDPEYDVSTVLVHPTSFHVQAVAFNRDRLSWEVVDPEVGRDFEFLAGVRHGDLRIAGRDLADKTWIVSYLTDDGPIYYYAYDRDARSVSFLFSHRPELEGLPLARMQPMSFTARDGLTIHGYLTLPSQTAAQTNLPTVLLVHGGPWARDAWGFDPQSQWLANRGYAVLQLNYRGSAGFGRNHLNAGNREWGGRMHDDLIDGVNWLVERGISDPKRIAIMGGSYGGYATLAGLTFTPDVFAAGVDIVGPSSLITFIENIPPYWAPLLGQFKHRVGDPAKEEDFLKSRSPLFFADRIRAPLLIGQGANDPRVKQSESEQIVAAMKSLDLSVEYVVYEDEGHGFARPENRLHFFAVAEEFLSKHLGGDCEPLGEIAGHSGVRR